MDRSAGTTTLLPIMEHNPGLLEDRVGRRPVNRLRRNRSDHMITHRRLRGLGRNIGAELIIATDDLLI